MQAAAVMGQLRNALRAYAAEGHEPAAVLSRTQPADERPRPVAVRHLLLPRRSTCAPARATVALAGHPPPLRRTADGTVEALDGTGRALRSASPRRSEYATRSGDARGRRRAGALHRRPGRGLQPQPRRRAATRWPRCCSARSPVDDLDALADRLMSESLPAGASDDVAVLVVRYRPPGAASRPVTARFSVDRSDPRAARAARDAIAGFVGSPRAGRHPRHLRAAGVGGRHQRAAAHRRRVWLELWRFPDRLRVEVSDQTSRGLVTGGGGCWTSRAAAYPSWTPSATAGARRPRGARQGRLVRAGPATTPSRPAP